MVQLSPGTARIAGVSGIVICLVTWMIDLTHLTYPCLYCRTERTIIGILGIFILIFPLLNVYVSRYLATVFGAYGFIIAANQHFMGWLSVFNGTYVFGKGGPWYFDAMMLSCAAMFIIVFEIFVLFTMNRYPQKHDG